MPILRGRAPENLSISRRSANCRRFGLTGKPEYVRTETPAAGLFIHVSLGPVMKSSGYGAEGATDTSTSSRAEESALATGIVSIGISDKVCGPSLREGHYPIASGGWNPAVASLWSGSAVASAAAGEPPLGTVGKDLRAR